MPFNKGFSGGSATVSLLLYNAVITNLTATISSTVSSALNVVVTHAPLAELMWEVTGPQASGEVFDNGTIRARDSYSNPVINMATPANPVTITVGAPATGTVTLGDANNVLEPDNFEDGVANLVTQGLAYTGITETVRFIATAQNGTVGEIDIEINATGEVEGTSIGAPLVSEEEVVTLGTVGDTVWLDKNGNGTRDAGEPGMEGVTVNLFTAEGVFVMADTTDGNGKYLFSGVEVGSYYVEFASVPGYAFTHAQTSGGAQSDADSDATVPQIDIGVVVGDQAWNYTAMVPWVGSGNASIGSERSGSEAAAGSEWDEKFVYTLVYTNTDSARDASEVVIRVALPAGSSFVAEESTPGWQCAEDGTCSLTLGEVASGASASPNFVVSRESAQVSVSEPPNLAVRVTQSTAARSAPFALELAETNLTIDAGLVPLVSSVPESVPDLPSADEPAQSWSIFLPTVRTQE
jgi:hypothetical protein